MNYLPVDLWQKYASPVWLDIDYSRTLQYRSGRDGNDEKHICPLQLDTIERIIHLYSNEGETVFSPFGGIGSEGFAALHLKRKSISIELKESYFKINAKNHSDKSLVTVYAEELISHAVAKMRKFNISQIPVLKDDQIVGSLNDTHTYQFLMDHPDKINAPVSSIAQAPFPVVVENTPIEEVTKLINKETPAVLVELNNGSFHIITRQDIIASFA